MNVYELQLKYASAVPGGISIDFGFDVCAIALKNFGSKGCWFKLDGNPVAAFADGQGYLEPGDSFSVDCTKCRTIGLITAGSDTTDVQAAATVGAQP